MINYIIKDLRKMEDFLVNLNQAFPLENLQIVRIENNKIFLKTKTLHLFSDLENDFSAALILSNPSADRLQPLSSEKHNVDEPIRQGKSVPCARHYNPLLIRNCS